MASIWIAWVNGDDEVGQWYFIFGSRKDAEGEMKDRGFTKIQTITKDKNYSSNGFTGELYGERIGDMEYILEQRWFLYEGA